MELLMLIIAVVGIAVKIALPIIAIIFLIKGIKYFNKKKDR